MADLVKFSKQGSIGIITVDNPPVNALSPGVPEGIIECVNKGNADPDVKAMVFTGAGRAFIAGADIKHLGKPKTQAGLTYRPIIDDSPKPIVAAIHGFALGGGLETALSCQYRIAAKSAKVGLPEVTIGVLPGGGGTQRLPRIVGPKKALELITTGRHIPAPEACELGILDAVVEDDDLLSAAIAFAEKIADVRPLPRIRDRDEKLAEAKANPGMFDAARKTAERRQRGQIAPLQAIKCVEAAVTLPFDEGLQRERDLFDEISNLDQGKAMRYAFFAQRQANKIPDIGKDIAARDVNSAAVIGSGTMGGGIAMVFADAGIPVKLLDMSQEALDYGIAKITANYETSVKRGSMPAEDLPKRLALIEPVLDFDAIKNVDMVIEAVYEEMNVKKAVFARLDEVMKPDAVLATNTSTLDIDQIAGATKRPESVIGTHFFSPANVMKLLEIVRGKATGKDIVATCTKLSRQLDKVGVVCGNCDGFLANRSRGPFGTEMNILVEEGATPQQVDRVMVEFGYPMGPFAVADLAGLDISYAVRKYRASLNPNGYRKLPIPDKLVEMGRHGQKTRAGWYLYKEGDRTPYPDPLVTEVIAGVVKDLAIEQREFTDDEVLQRLLFASVNEAAKIIEESIAYRASDVDVMWVNGFGFPRYKGGLMYWADGIGVKNIHDTMLQWQDRYGDRWKPAKLISGLAAAGKGFLDD
ncbi:MAG: 3-hydroxyacyl-CoA dehydrogenase NAD-binding domain-containing protein [Proteobacteria bacterium]|nr:3-hydroxyacyl-CoA dehydrogenase NAD-binding domain-containing protein [Pseudomonadota bacterium]